MKKNIFKVINKNYIKKLFENKKLIYFPEQKNKKIIVVEIEKISPNWAKETCLAKYKIFFDDDNFKIIRGTASNDGAKRKMWKIMSYLARRGFGQGDLRIARPLDFISESNLLLYEEAQGVPLSSIVQNGNVLEIEDGLRKAAIWLSKLHELNLEGEKLPTAIFLNTRDYEGVFQKIKKLIPGLKEGLALASELKFKEILQDKRVLIHNDFYPGNVIISQNIVFGIDFNKSGLGFSLMDIAALFSWFELPDEISDLNFGQKDTDNFQEIFLENYCNLRELDYFKTRQKLNIFLAKVFLDQTHNYSVIATKGWNNFDSLAKKAYQGKIKALIKKTEQYL